MKVTATTFTSTLFVLLTSSGFFFNNAVSAVFCDLVTEGISGLDTEYELPSGTLEVQGFDADYIYTTIPSGATPYVKILAASEQPAVFVTDGGVLTISPETCDVENPIETDPPTSAAFKKSSWSIATLSSMMYFLPTTGRATTLFTAATLLASASWVKADEDCKPKLSIEIGVPDMAPVTPVFGETDHYLPANYSTVVWGYYDPEATAATSPVTMASGETITIEVITHHGGHDYAKMIRGDQAIEEIFAWESTQSIENKTEPKLPGSGVHLITGPVNIEGGMPGDILQVDILELDPRPNPDGRTFGTNSQKFAGYHFRLGEKRDGTPYTRSGGTEAITVFEFIQDEDDNMLYGKPVYMYRFPNMTRPDGGIVNIDNNPAVVVPQEFNYGYNGELLETEPIVYPPGFDDLVVTDEGGILYLNPDPAELDWKVPLRPHLGTLAVMPSNTANYIDDAATGGASTIPPSRFGGNIDDYRIGKGGTMYYKCEVEGCLLLAGDTHAAQGDSELAGTAMETSMTAKLRVTLHKADNLPALVTGLDWPLLETSTEYVVHGFAFSNYLDQLDDPSTIFAEGASIDAAMEDCYYKTRNWLMDAWGLIEEETIALMTTSIDFGVTQVVDGNWGAHAIVPKFVFDMTGAKYDYSCHTSGTAGRRRDMAVDGNKNRRHLQAEERQALYEMHSRESLSLDEYSDRLFAKVTKSCESCDSSSMRGLLANKLLDTKLQFIEKRIPEN